MIKGGMTEPYRLAAARVQSDRRPDLAGQQHVACPPFEFDVVGRAIVFDGGSLLGLECFLPGQSEAFVERALEHEPFLHERIANLSRQPAENRGIVGERRLAAARRSDGTGEIELARPTVPVSSLAVLLDRMAGRIDCGRVDASAHARARRRSVDIFQRLTSRRCGDKGVEVLRGSTFETAKQQGLVPRKQILDRGRARTAQET